MKIIKELAILKKQLFLIENLNIKIEKLSIRDVHPKDPFYLNKIEFFIDKKIINVCFQIIQNFSLKELGMNYIKILSNVISNSNDLNFIIYLLNHNYVVLKNPNEKFLSNDDVKMMFDKLIKSNDPIIYLKTALYSGIRWSNNNNISYEKRREIDKIILSYNFNQNNDANNSYYVSLLISYCKNFFTDRWKEAENKIFHNNIWVKDYIYDVIKFRAKDIEEKILEINNPRLYFNYYKNVLKKPWEDFKGSMDDKIIDAAISSIESNYLIALDYSELTKKRVRPETEKKFLNILKEKLSDLKSILDGGDVDIYQAYEIGNSNVYELIRYFKKRFPEFEEILLNYSNKNGGLKITGIPYDPEIDEDTDKLHRTILDEAIYNYTITNRGGTWPEIGIHNREDLLKLRNQIVDHGTLQFRLRGYGELDY